MINSTVFSRPLVQRTITQKLPDIVLNKGTVDSVALPLKLHKKVDSLPSIHKLPDAALDKKMIRLLEMGEIPKITFKKVMFHPDLFGNNTSRYPFPIIGNREDFPKLEISCNVREIPHRIMLHIQKKLRKYFPKAIIKMTYEK